MDSFDVLFYCNASAEVGFGHLRRCLFLAGEIEEDGIKDIAFAGAFDHSAKRLIHEEAPESRCLDDLNGVECRVVVIDYMFDSQHMDAYDVSLIAEVAKHASGSVLMSSSATVPSELPVDVVVGHLLDSTQETNFKLKAGLQYAPVAPGVEEYRPTEPRAAEQVERIFVGFGNVDNPSGVHLALGALQQIDYSDQVDLLLPPALTDRADEFRDRERSFELTLHHNIPSVPALLNEADCMIGSYGHMTFEALALGMPIVVVGMKVFMVEYADQVAERDMLVSAGYVDDLDAENLAVELLRLDVSRRRILSSNSLSRLDGKGLQRAAREIFDLASRGAVGGTVRDRSGE
jgi:spore coat polysaccharide biosynthesis predicted glycosyltransferase SpsG